MNYNRSNWTRTAAAWRSRSAEALGMSGEAIDGGSTSDFFWGGGKELCLHPRDSPREGLPNYSLGLRGFRVTVKGLTAPVLVPCRA